MYELSHIQHVLYLIKITLTSISYVNRPVVPNLEQKTCDGHKWLKSYILQFTNTQDYHAASKIDLDSSSND